MTIGSVRRPRLTDDSFVGGAAAADVPGGRSTDGAGANTRQKPAKSFERRRRVVLSCAACGGRNYRTTKARQEGSAPLQLNKFCSICNAHTQHREAV